MSTAWSVPARRLARFKPTLRQANLLAPLERSASGAPFESVGLTYVLHCLPGAMGDKLVVLDHLRPLMAEGAVLFGATILGRGVPVNAPARALLDIYNAKGVFDNREDDHRDPNRGSRGAFRHRRDRQAGLRGPVPRQLEGLRAR